MSNPPKEHLANEAVFIDRLAIFALLILGPHLGGETMSVGHNSSIKRDKAYLFNVFQDLNPWLPVRRVVQGNNPNAYHVTMPIKGFYSGKQFLVVSQRNQHLSMVTH